ncbi:MAG: ATP-binding cassette domain-containing protein [Ardenticatenaceae bacterium]
MFFNLFASDNREFLAPEVVQTSAMDCGPAALKSLLDGFGIPVSYGRLREACQTSVDGTSIDVIEEVANQLGLEAEQVMIPADHLLLSESQSLPALVVIRQPNGLTHFVVVWRRHGPFVQVMDPGTGRRWQRHQSLLRQLYVHQLPVPAEAWREWAGSDGFCDPLRERMRLLQLDEADIERLINGAREDPNWRPLAVLDAATRMVEGIVRADGLEAGAEAGQVLERFFKGVAGSPGGIADCELRIAESKISEIRGFASSGDPKSEIPPSLTIPDTYWSVLPPSPERNLPEGYVLLQGAVLIRVLGTHAIAPPELETSPAELEAEEATSLSEWQAEGGRQPLSPELVAALEETPANPLLELWHLLQEDGLLAPTVLAAALMMATVGVMIEALLFRGLLDLGVSLQLLPERILAVSMLFLFLTALFLIEWPIANTMARIGRRLESRLRVKFFEKIPRLGDRYFHSRLTSDMAQRAYELRQLRVLPQLGVQWLRLLFEILLTALGVIWLNPSEGLIALLATVFAVGFSIITQPLLVEQDLVMRTHIGALSSFYLDALLGLMPIRTHSAERAVRRQHENLLVEWAHASQKFYQADTGIKIAQSVVGSFFAFWILYDYLATGGEPSGVLLLFYWTLRLPALGQALAQATQQYPMHRNRVLRLLEPLGAPEEIETVAQASLPVSGEGETVAQASLPVPEEGDSRGEPLRSPEASLPVPEEVAQASILSIAKDLPEEVAQASEPVPEEQDSRGVPLRSPEASLLSIAKDLPEGALLGLEDLSVQAGGHTILSNINLTLQAGEHIGIVGPSGAGKSSLVGILLGWHRPATGQVLVDGQPLRGKRLLELRRQVAWVDPGVQLWNRTLLQNLNYGSQGENPELLNFVIEQADLFDVLERLPAGLQTPLGEGGGLLSGGQGQRVRLGRAMRREGVRLVILDEPFRGLDRPKRRELLARARQYWQHATLIFISHDVGQTQTFERVLVIEKGQIVEDDVPKSLLAQPDSRYKALLEAEEAVRKGMWERKEWRRLWLENGRVSQKEENT